MTIKDKKLFFKILALLCFLFLLEGLSALVITFYYGKELKINYANEPSKLEKELFEELSSDQWEVYGNIFKEKRIRHPYFGFSFDITRYIDQHGFYGDIKLPYKKRKKDYIVAILGGSYAQMFANYISTKPIERERLYRQIKKIDKKSKDKDFKYIIFAKGGMKQPQQFLISAFFSEIIDLAINIDGYNEFSSAFPVYPVSYPMGVDNYTHVKETTSYVDEVKGIRAKKKKLDRLMKSPFISSSQTVYLFYYVMVKSYYYIMLENINKVFRTYISFKSLAKDKELYIDEHVDNWINFTRKQQNVIRRNGAKVISIVQPNHVVEGSKNYTQIEKNEFIKDRPLLKRYYSKLVKSARGLRRDGYTVFDATYVYKDVDEQVYIDSCCHVNDRGNEIMLNFILEKIQALR